MAPARALVSLAVCLKALPTAHALGMQARSGEGDAAVDQRIEPVSGGMQGSSEPAVQLDHTLRTSGLAVEGPLTGSPLMETQILFISSPSAQKIVYTQLRDFKSVTGMTYPLVDAGLAEPCGLAVDRRQGVLYVADRGQSAIFRYLLLAHQDRDGIWQIQTDGTRVTMVNNRAVEWISVDQNGTLFFTDRKTNSVNKVQKQVLDRIAIGDYTADDLQVVSEHDQQRTQYSNLLRLSGSTNLTASTKASELFTAKPRILSMYEGSEISEVSAPAGVIADGPRLFWANSAGGLSDGSVVQGQVQPWAPPNTVNSLDSKFPTVKIANATDEAYGLTKTNTLLFFTGRNAVTMGHDAVFGVNQYGGPVYTVAPGLSKPRGLAWDGDNTVYVADSAKSEVWSMPAGRLVAGAPMAKAVEFTGAFGLAIMSRSDAGFSLMSGGSAPAAAPTPRLQLTLLALMLTALGVA